MFVRIVRVLLVTSSLVAVAALAGCTSDPAPDSPSETGSAKGKGTGKSGPTEPDEGEENTPGFPGDSTPSKPGDSDEPSPGASKKDNGGQCKDSADCKSDFCVFQGNGLGMCTTTCDGDIDCDLSWKCVKLSNAPQKVCVPE